MQVYGLARLHEFSRKHANARAALTAWHTVVEQAEWNTTHDIKARFAQADFLVDNRVIFNIKGNHYRLLAKVNFQAGIVLVEWIGTHAEYDKKSF